MKRICLLMSSFLIVISGCSKKESSSSSNQCPSGVSAPSNLPVAPPIQAAVPIHANGINTTWNWQLKGTLNTGYNVNVYDVDLFETSAAQITSLKLSGKKVVCYFSAGSSEDWRDDFGNFLQTDMGKNLDGWAGERWLDVRSQNVLDIMETRMNLAVTKGCDGVEPDNMDGYTQDSCFDISADEQLAYNRAIANMARSKGLSVALKNDPDQILDLKDYFDFSVSEQCYYYNECASYLPFVTDGKPVFNAEYETVYRSDPSRSTLCTYSNTNDIQTIVFDLNLDDSFRFQCF